MAKYGDDRTAGRSKLVPFIPGEAPSARHARRLEANMRAEDEVRLECERYGVAVTISNGGHHWRLNGPNGVAEWWPSSAKLVINKQWRKGIHVHDHTQLLRQLNRNGFLK